MGVVARRQVGIMERVQEPGVALGMTSVYITRYEYLGTMHGRLSELRVGETDVAHLDTRSLGSARSRLGWASTERTSPQRGEMLDLGRSHYH